MGDELQVPHQRLQVKEAPNIEPDGQLSAAEEAELFRHYGLDYDSVTLDNGAPAGQPLAEPAGQASTRRTATSSGSDRGPRPKGPASAAGAGRHRDRREPGPRLLAGVPGWTESRLTPASRVRAGPGDARDGLSATGGGEPVEPAGQDRLPVGEGVSRPFVYETPGRPEGGAGPRRRQPGQVRLRRYLVTEVVTETEAGQRHEVRVQSEPVSDAEVDAVRAAPDRTSRSVRTRTGLVAMTGSVMKGPAALSQPLGSPKPPDSVGSGATGYLTRGRSRPCFCRNAHSVSGVA